VIPPALFFCLGIALAIHGLLDITFLKCDEQKQNVKVTFVEDHQSLVLRIFVWENIGKGLTFGFTKVEATVVPTL
jgi:hypothetical protein